MNPSTNDQIEGKIHEVKGKIKETVGQVTKDPNLESEGQSENRQCLPFGTTVKRGVRG